MTNTPTSPPSPGTSSPGERTQCFLMHEPTNGKLAPAGAPRRTQCFLMHGTTNSKLSATRRPGVFINRVIKSVNN